MPFPYNIFQIGDLLWLTYGYASWIFGAHTQIGHSFLEARLPEEDLVWSNYGPEGWPQLTPINPHHNPDRIILMLIGRIIGLQY